MSHFCYAQLMGEDRLTRQIAKILADRQAELGLSLRQIEEKSGVTRMSVSRILSGSSAMPLDKMEAVSIALGLVPWQVMRAAEESVAMSRSESLGGAKGEDESEAEIILLNRLDVDLPPATIPTVTLSAEELAAPAAAKNSPSTKRKTQQYAEDSGAD